MQSIIFGHLHPNSDSNNNHLCKTLTKCDHDPNVSADQLGWFPIAGCSAGESRWIEVYSQDRPSTEFENCNFSSCNIFLDDENFINLDQYQYQRQYRLKLQWDGDKTIEWTQKNNPLDQSVSNTNQRVCENNGCILSDGLLKVGIIDTFAGLSISTTKELTLLDGYVGSDWWYSIGYSQERIRIFS